MDVKKWASRERVRNIILSTLGYIAIFTLIMWATGNIPLRAGKQDTTRTGGDRGENPYRPW